MFDVIFPRNGAILNHNHGRETADGLEIEVRGVGGVTGCVTVNGVPAAFDGTGFAAKVILKEKFNRIKAVFEDAYGTLTREFQVVWDKGSFKRYNFFIDDNSFFLTEIARDRPASLFDHFYLKFLREMNRKYGAKITLNCFFENAHDPDHFTMDKFPTDYKAEFQDNAEWLRLSFHARSEFPDRIYQNSDAETLGRDFDRVVAEIERFAGAEAYIAPVVLHWAICRPEAIKALTDRGVRVLEGQFINPRTGIDDGGTPEMICDIGYFMNLDDARYLEAQRKMWDFRHNVAYCKGDCTANLWTPAQIREMVTQVANSTQGDTLSIATHEQYTFPHYFNYLPDHCERVETDIRTATELGYKPVFFAQGFFGNTAWGE